MGLENAGYRINEVFAKGYLEDLIKILNGMLKERGINVVVENAEYPIATLTVRQLRNKETGEFLSQPAQTIEEVINVVFSMIKLLQITQGGRKP